MVREENLIDINGREFYFENRAIAVLQIPASTLEFGIRNLHTMRFQIPAFEFSVQGYSPLNLKCGS